MANYRGKITRLAHPKIYIWSHTAKAEIEYFQQFKNYLKSPLLVAKKELCREPNTLLDKVVIWKNNQNNFNEQDGDQVWCIFDVDDFYNKNSLLLIKAIKHAQTSGIRIAYANECFELWILLHFVVPTASIKRGEELHKKIREHFKKNKLGNFVKNQPVFGLLAPFQGSAIQNSQKLFSRYTPNDWDRLLSNKGNPSTNIHVLIEEINRVIT
jgi:hypothetical protein